MDEHHQEALRDAAEQHRRDVGRRTFAHSGFGRLRQDGGDPGARRRDRDRPRHRRGLKPWYGYFCKRPCFHDEYLQAFNRDNVTLVDTQGLGVERSPTTGVVVDGTEYSLDCLIFATGFEVGTDYSRRTGFEVVGRDGLTLTDKWRDGVRTFHGLTRSRLPQLLRAQHRPVGLHRELPVSARRPGHATSPWVIAWALNNDATELEASADAEAAWVDTVVARSVGERRTGEVVHTGLLQPGRPGEREDPTGQFLLSAGRPNTPTSSRHRGRRRTGGIRVRRVP